MQIECPRGYKTKGKVGNIEIVFHTVNICGGYCDCGDLCKIEDCEFYDLS